MPPAASPAIQSILATLDLATRFAFLIVVGPDDHPELARWSLAVHLNALGQEVLWHSLADADLDLPALLERAQSPNPVVIASGIEALSPEDRHARFARMNLERDVWGQYPVRVVLWCSAEHIDRLQHLAPDLFHWRSLIQPLSAQDLCVFDRTTYLAWLADECAEGSDDRVLAGSQMLLRDPIVLPLEGDQTGARPLPFSHWIRRHRRGLLLRATPHDPRYPAKSIVRSLALRRLDGHLDSPYPLLLATSQLHRLSSMTASAGQVAWDGEAWTLLDPRDEDRIVFVFESGTASQDIESLSAAYPRATWILATEDGDRWRAALPDWAHAIAMAVIDPLGTDGSGSDTLHALGTLLRELFTTPTLFRFLTLTQGDDFSKRLLEAPHGDENDLAGHAANRLLAEGRITSALFANIRALRPRSWRDISRVEQMFAALAQADP